MNTEVKFFHGGRNEIPCKRPLRGVPEKLNFPELFCKVLLRPITGKRDVPFLIFLGNLPLAKSMASCNNFRNKTIIHFYGGVCVISSSVVFLDCLFTVTQSHDFYEGDTPTLII